MEKVSKNILYKEGNCRKHMKLPPLLLFSISGPTARHLCCFLHSPSAVVLLQATFVSAAYSRMQFNVCENPVRNKRKQRRFPLQIKTNKFKIRILILLRTCCSTVLIPGLKRKKNCRFIPVYTRKVEIRANQFAITEEEARYFELLCLPHFRLLTH